MAGAKPKDTPAQRAEQSAFRWAAFVALAAILVISVLVTSVIIVTDSQSALDQVPEWIIISVSLVVGAGLVWLFYFVYNKLVSRFMPNEVTVAATWAQDHHWKYRMVEDDLDEEVWQAAFPDAEDVSSISESIHGQWQGFDAWAFAFRGFSRRYSREGEAVVLRLTETWEDEFQASRDIKLLGGLIKGVVIGVGGSTWHVGGDDSPQLRAIMADRDLADQLLRPSLPKQALLSIYGDFVAVEVPWTNDLPLLEHCLDLLVSLAKACQKAQTEN